MNTRFDEANESFTRLETKLDEINDKLTDLLAALNISAQVDTAQEGRLNEPEQNSESDR